MDDPIVAAARSAHKAGLAVVPPKEDGTKRPDVGEWTTYQTRRPTGEELRTWYASGRGGVGLVMGAVSGGLETIEFDDRPTYERYIEIAQGTGLGDVVSRIRAGYEETTPGGGIHWPYRCADIAGNTTLARRPTEDPKRLQVLIQTRGEGGYLVVAPSNGRVHPTGGAYRLVSGGFGTIATIAPEERRGLWDLARTFDECPRPAREEPSAPASGAGNRPGDHFNQRATWDEILASHDWVLVHERGGVGYWRRPGKSRGLSATTNHANSGLFYPFTSSTVFDSERGYSKFACYTILEHGGDFSAAADALGKAGYGPRLPRSTLGARKAAEAGARDDTLRMEKLTIVANDPRLWRVAVNGCTLETVATPDLLSFSRFQIRCVDVLNFLPTLPPERGISEARQWKDIIAPFIEAAEQEEIPEDSTETGRLRAMVERYVYDLDRHTDRRTELPQGRILRHEGALHVRMSDLIQFLREQGFDPRGLGSQVWSLILRPAGATSVVIRADAATTVRVVRLPFGETPAPAVTPLQEPL